MTDLRKRLAEVLEGDAEPGHFLRDPALARALEDAERYQWLIETCQQSPDEYGVGGQLYFGTYPAGQLGQTIDAAIAARSEK